MILDGHKLAWHMDRVEAWERGERIAPITIDMALTRGCNAHCQFCYSTLQQNEGKRLTIPILERFLSDCKDLGVRGVSLVSDGESTLSPSFEFFIQRAKALGLSVALGTNGILFEDVRARLVLSCLDYCRFNISGGTARSYARIMGTDTAIFHEVVRNIRWSVELKKAHGWPVTIGMQMVLMPEYEAEVIPLSELAISCGVDYLVIKHCSDDEDGSLGVDYSAYEALEPTLRKAEEMSTEQTKIVVKWSKIRAGNVRSYSRCYGPPFILQLSGSGLVAPCGMLFGEKYKRYHIGNIAEQSFKEIVQGDRYRKVMNELRSERFDARTMCGCLCLQHKVNEALDDHVEGRKKLVASEEPLPIHASFL